MTNSVEVADIVLRSADSYLQNYSPSPQQRKALRDIARCRTAELGGHRYCCDKCGHQEQSYNSCRNRNCPKCQGSKAFEWVQARKQEFLPMPYFQVVFTLPHELNQLTLHNQRLIYDLLFQAVSKTIRKAALKCFKSEIGMLCAKSENDLPSIPKMICHRIPKMICQ